jgi:8-oxo-dGTP diphosphatase
MSAGMRKSGRAAMTVVAALIVRDGKILIGQRRLSESFGGKWEFPGGKVEPREQPRAALARELWEELEIRAGIGDEILRYEYQYPGRAPIDLIFYRVSGYAGEPANRAFEQIAWASPENLPSYDFLDGDVEFVRRIAENKFV